MITIAHHYSARLAPLFSFDSKDKAKQLEEVREGSSEGAKRIYVKNGTHFGLAEWIYTEICDHWLSITHRIRITTGSDSCKPINLIIAMFKSLVEILSYVGNGSLPSATSLFDPRTPIEETVEVMEKIALFYIKH